MLTKRLKKKGIKFFLGHNKKHIKNAHAIVYSSAIKKNNPEIREAYIKKIPVQAKNFDLLFCNVLHIP